MDGNDKPVIQIDVYLRARPFSVDTNYRSRVAIRACGYPVDTPVIVNGLCQRYLTTHKEKKTKKQHGVKKLLDAKLKTKVVLKAGIAYFIGMVPLDLPRLGDGRVLKQGKRGPKDWDRNGWKSCQAADADTFLWAGSEYWRDKDQ